MSAAAGWYDDPKDPTKLRYWDGVMWTANETPKASPTVAQSHIGAAYPVPPAHATHQQPAPVPPWQQRSGGLPNAPARAPQWQQPRPMGVVTTPDGVETAGWWKRVLARIVDNILITLLSLPFTGWFYWHYAAIMQTWFSAVMDNAAAGRQTSTGLPVGSLSYLVPIALLTVLVYAVYEVYFVTRTGATPGKKLVGISVRLREVAGPPPLKAVLTRFGIWQGSSVLSLLPLLGTFFGVFQLVDSLWPLWDPGHQALHDRVAGTNVVLGPQPRPGSGRNGSGSAGTTGSSDGSAGDRPADQVGSGSL